MHSMFEKFKSLAPIDINQKKYGGRVMRPTSAKWDLIAADFQKFRASLRFIMACNSTGVTEDQVMSMVIAKNLGKRDSMYYDGRDFRHERWNHHLAFKTLRRISKSEDSMNDSLHSHDESNASWTNIADRADEVRQEHPINEQPSPGRAEAGNLQPVQPNDFANDPQNHENADSDGSSACRGGHVGRKNAKDTVQKK